jgi:nucleoside-diphosphate-sugar epimerase
MQIPFCAVDPIKGAQTNVVGFVNIMEAARKNDIKRIAYASSIAAYGLMDSKKYQPTFYGAYKVCNEHYCEALFKNNGVPSIGLRPSIVYGVGRDQGMTAKPTEAILAAAAKKKFTIPFSGPISVLYAGEVAAAFIKAVSKDISDAMVFDINGSFTSVEDWCGLVRKINPDSSIAIEGNSLPFPVGMSDDPLREQVGDYGIIDPEEGIKLTYMAFSQLLSEGKLKM